MKRIILLNGPSSSGKSTLSRNLQALLAARKSLRFQIVSIDDFIKVAQDETIYEDDVFEISGDMCRQVLQLLRGCDGVIIDHVITSERIFTQLESILEGYDLSTVHVTCPFEVLLERERERGNRCPGTAQSSFEYLYPKDGYDLTVNTHSMTSDECAVRIFEELFTD